MLRAVPRAIVEDSFCGNMFAGNEGKILGRGPGRWQGQYDDRGSKMFTQESGRLQMSYSFFGDWVRSGEPRGTGLSGLSDRSHRQPSAGGAPLSLFRMVRAMTRGWTCLGAAKCCKSVDELDRTIMANRFWCFLVQNHRKHIVSCVHHIP